MLFGKDLGRCHQGCLITRFNGLTGGQRCDHRLAAADIALQQPLCWLGSLQVLLDLAPDTLLCGREVKRQATAQLLGQKPRRLQARRILLAAQAIGAAKGQLLGDQFIELDSTPGGLILCLQGGHGNSGSRAMQRTDGLCQRRQPHLFWIKRIGEVNDRQRGTDQAPQVGLRHTGRGRIDRGQRAGQTVTRCHHAIARMNHFVSEIAPPDFTKQTQRPPLIARRLQLLELASVEVEKTDAQLTGGIGKSRHQLTPRPILNRDVDDSRFKLYRTGVERVGNRPDRRLVFVSQRQMQRQIDVAVQA